MLWEHKVCAMQRSGHEQLHWWVCRTVKQLLDVIEQARAGDFAEGQPPRLAPSLASSQPQSAGPSLEGPRRQQPPPDSSSGGGPGLQPMRASQGMPSAARQGSGALGGISPSAGSGGTPSWTATAGREPSSRTGTLSGSVGGPSLSDASKPSAGEDCWIGPLCACVHAWHHCICLLKR